MSSTTPSTVRNLQRWWEVQSIFLRYGFDMLVDKTSLGNAKRKLRESTNGRPVNLAQLDTPTRMRLMIEELGPTFIKLGQVISSQSATIPPEWQRELEKLQSGVPPFPEEQVRSIIVQELGAEPEYLFREFDFKPLAAASIGQVHTALLNNYQSVVVKVQRPGIVTQIESDLAIMREVARMLEATTSIARNYGAAGIVDEFAASITRELDYHNEARNMERLRDVLAPIHGARTPVVYWEFVTSKVLTMERIEGVKITRLGAPDTSIDRSTLPNTFVKAMVQQILIEGFFHADVHPGNVFVEPKTGEIVFIDVGMTGSLDAKQRARLIDLMRGLAQRDARRLANVVLDLGDTFKPVDPDVLERNINALVKKHLSGALADFSYATFLSELLSTLFNNGVRTPSDLMFALKAIMQTEQIVRVLNPDFNITELAGMASSQVLAHQLRPATLLSHVTTTLDQVLRIAPMLGDAVEQYTRDTRSGKRITRLDPADVQHISQMVNSTANRFMLVMLLIGMMLSSVLVLALPVNPSLPFLPWIGIIGFAASVLLATFVVLLQFFTHRK